MSACPDVHPSIFIACLLYPEGRIVVGGLSPCIGCGVTGDIDGNEHVFLIPLILLSDFVGGPTVSDPPVPTITGPDRRDIHRLPIGVGTEPHRTVTRFAESLRGREELVHGIVWQKANRSEMMPGADSIRLTKEASGLVHEATSGGSFQV